MRFLQSSTKEVLFPVLTRKRHGPRIPTVHPLRAKRRQISLSGQLRARSPDPARLLSPKGARCLGLAQPSGSSGYPNSGDQEVQTSAAIRWQRWGWGKGSPPATSRPGGSSGWPWWGLWSPARTQTPAGFPESPCSSADHRASELEGPGERLTLFLPQAYRLRPTSL